MTEERPTPPLRSADALDWPLQAGCVDPVLKEIEACVRERRVCRRRRWTSIAAVGVAAAVVAIGLLAPRGLFFAERAPSSTTIVSAPERQVLPDQSVIELKGGAVVRVAYSDSERRVELVRGEAHFQVAKNPGRPFVVAAGALEVKAVGTAFAVQLAPAAVEVLVTEGRVALQATGSQPDAPRTEPSASQPAVQPATQPTSPSTARPGGGASIASSTVGGAATFSGGGASARSAFDIHSTALALVDVGNRAVVPSGGANADAGTAAAVMPRITRVSPSEMEARLSWRVPRLEFNATPLEEAVALMNRHGRTRLVLEDRALGSLQVSGTVRADNALALVRLLELQYGLASDASRTGEIVLSKGE